MTPDERPLADPNDHAERQMREELGPDALSSVRREALLRRILQRTGGAPPLAPAPPPETD